MKHTEMLALPAPVKRRPVEYERKLVPNDLQTSAKFLRDFADREESFAQRWLNHNDNPAYHYAVEKVTALRHGAQAIEHNKTLGKHGWLCYNDGPCGWFWCATWEETCHELTDPFSVRPATAVEKAIFNKLGNSLFDSDALAAAGVDRDASKEARHALGDTPT